jgi:hypothetical protein
MFSEKDLQLLAEKGIDIEKANWQLEQFRKGVAPIKLHAPATPEKGIKVLENPGSYAELFSKMELKVTKFVPASGAASRMFKALFEFKEALNNDPDAPIEGDDFISKFFQQIKKFAFYSDLDQVLKEEGGMERVMAEKKYKLVLDTLLDESGLNYGNLPKGLLKFHFYAGNIGRTPFEEHLVEGAKYAMSKGEVVNLHFTVSPEHVQLFKALLETVVSKYEDMYRVKYQVSFSVQKPSTDTLAVNPDNTPFYNNDGNIFFRPGGHGALIENLNDLDSDVIFIKNIDNVVPEKRLDSTILMKKAIAGVLLETQKDIFRFCRQLEDDPNENIVAEALEFLEGTLCLTLPDIHRNNPQMILSLLNRPLRVCGMVKNEGEPGGGPFLVINHEGSVSPQVVESSQVDSKNSDQMQILQGATHFNPVDLVCAVKDYKGNKFDLTSFVDEKTCFISKKSKNGKDLKALELPGLWNGAMAHWNTIFVEVPINTFNPVKTVNDLLRESHQ